MKEPDTNRTPLVRALSVGRTRRRPPPPDAGTQTVCLCTDGRYVCAGDLAFGEAHLQRYSVNTSAHFEVEDIPLPAQEDAFLFQSTIDVGWCVVDPITVVAHNVRDGWARILSELQAAMRQISRRYPVEECAAADEDINRTLGNRSIQLPYGLYVSSFAARLTLDEQTREHLQELRNIGYRSRIDQRRIEATRRALEGDNSLIISYLARNPGETREVIRMIAESNNRAEQQRAATFKDLLDRNVIQDADLDDLSRDIIDRHREAVARPNAPAGHLAATDTGEFTALRPANGETPEGTVNGSQVD